MTTCIYMDDEKTYALNLGGSKAWYKATFMNFESWADKADIPWRAIKSHLDDTLNRARALWPKALTELLPMDNMHKQQLIKHWNSLHQDFRIETGTEELRNSVRKFDDPLEPVALDGWDVLK